MVRSKREGMPTILEECAQIQGSVAKSVDAYKTVYLPAWNHTFISLQHNIPHVEQPKTEPTQDVKPDRRAKTVSRKHHGNLGPAAGNIGIVFRHVIRVAEAAAMVSRTTGVTDTHTLDTMIYHMVHDPRVGSVVTQAAIKTGAAAMKAAGSDAEPEFKIPMIKLNNTRWRLNPVAGGYLATGNVGSGKHPVHVVIGVPKDVGDRVSKNRLGELTITPDKYTISYTKDVDPIPGRDPALGNKYSVVELTSGVDRVAGPAKNVLGIDINATNMTISDSHTTTQIDMSEEVESVLAAKVAMAKAAKRDHSGWETKRGRTISHDREHAKEARNRTIHGGPRKHRKLKRLWKAAGSRRDAEKHTITTQEREALAEPRKLWRMQMREARGDVERQHAIKTERDQTTKAKKAETRRLKKAADQTCKRERARINWESKMCVVPQNMEADGASSLQKIAANNTKMNEAARASRRLMHVMHIMSLFVVSWAEATNALVGLEDLRGMSGGWMRESKKFGRGMRRKLYSSAMLALSDMVWYKARWANVEALRMNPYHTSKSCAACRCVLEGRDYHIRYCRRCNVRADRDVNASENVRLITAAARYGPEVRALPDEARRFADLTICPADLMTDGMAILVDGKVVWSRG